MNPLPAEAFQVDTLDPEDPYRYNLADLVECFVRRYDNDGDRAAFVEHVRLVSMPEIDTHLLRTAAGVVAFCCVQVHGSIVFILYLEAFQQRRGYGTRLVEHLRARYPSCTLEANDVLPEAKPFWRAMGVYFDE